MTAAVPQSRQFRALVRLFANRFFDTDIISVRGEISSLLSQAGALLAALSFVITLIAAPKYAGMFQRMTEDQLHTAAWADQEFLISTCMAVIGVLTLLLWDALFPDRRDCLVLGPMPVRVRTIFAAKLAALGLALGLAIVAVNSFTGLACPGLIAPSALRGYLAYWLVMVLAAAFVFLLLVCVQGLAIQLLPHGAFLRWSSLIQTIAFFAALSLYFLTPPLANPQALAAPENRLWYAVLPSYWFMGLFEVIVGSASPAFAELARRALAGVASVVLLAAVVYALAYARQMRRTVEQSGIVPARRSGAGAAAVLARMLSTRQPERAILAFVARTLGRSRQHRLLLAVYTGMGLAYVFSETAYVLYRFRASRFGAAEGRIETELAIPLVLLFFLIIGLRVSFSIPVEVHANWLFRLNDPFGSGIHLTSARKILLAFGLVPVLAASTPLYLAVWPWPRALGHIAFICVFGLLVIEFALTGFAKVPFTCAYLPGKANLKIMFGVYWVAVMGLSDVGTWIERQALENPLSWAKLMMVMLLAWRLAALRARGARESIGALTFEEQPEPAIATLGLAGPD